MENGVVLILAMLFPASIVATIMMTMMYPDWLDKLLEKPANFLLKL